MRTGSPPVRRAGGFTYLWLLFLIAAGGAALAPAVQGWGTAAQREREVESSFRGQQIADAIGAWRDASAPAEPPVDAGPYELRELLEDTRGPVVRRHLRRLYPDPMTGAPDWQLLRDADGAIVALHSRSTRPAVVTRGIAPVAGGAAPRVSDRVYRPRLPAP